MALVFQCRGCFIVMGLSSESVAPPSVWTERDLSPTWGSVSFKSFKREESEKSLWLPGKKRSLLLSSALMTGMRVPLLVSWFYLIEKGKVKVTQLCLNLFDIMDCNPSGSSVHGTLQSRILEWVAMPFSRGSSQCRDWTQVSHIALAS